MNLAPQEEGHNYLGRNSAGALGFNTQLVKFPVGSLMAASFFLGLPSQEQSHQ